MGDPVGIPILGILYTFQHGSFTFITEVKHRKANIVLKKEHDCGDYSEVIISFLH